jgi:hypothetical protein
MDNETLTANIVSTYKQATGKEEVMRGYRNALFDVLCTIHGREKAADLLTKQPAARMATRNEGDGYEDGTARA